MKVLVINDASDERSQELRERALHPVVADDHLDYQRVPGHDVVHLLDLVGHLLFEGGLKRNETVEALHQRSSRSRSVTESTQKPSGSGQREGTFNSEIRTHARETIRAVDSDKIIQLTPANLTFKNVWDFNASQNKALA